MILGIGLLELMGLSDWIVKDEKRLRSHKDEGCTLPIKGGVAFKIVSPSLNSSLECRCSMKPGTAHTGYLRTLGWNISAMRFG